MPFADAKDLLRDYEARPPLHVCVAVYLGFGPKEAPDGEVTADDVRRWGALEESLR